MILNLHRAMDTTKANKGEIIVNTDHISWVEPFKTTINGELKDVTALHMNPALEIVVSESFEDVKQALETLDTIKAANMIGLLGR